MNNAENNPALRDALKIITQHGFVYDGSADGWGQGCDFRYRDVAQRKYGCTTPELAQKKHLKRCELLCNALNRLWESGSAEPTWEFGGAAMSQEFRVCNYRLEYKPE